MPVSTIAFVIALIAGTKQYLLIILSIFLDFSQNIIFRRSFNQAVFMLKVSQKIDDDQKSKLSMQVG